MMQFGFDELSDTIVTPGAEELLRTRSYARSSDRKFIPPQFVAKTAILGP
jgi:hypothetical protein